MWRMMNKCASFDVSSTTGNESGEIFNDTVGYLTSNLDRYDQVKVDRWKALRREYTHRKSKWRRETEIKRYFEKNLIHYEMISANGI